MNKGYRTVAAEYAVWLDTLGYSEGLRYGCNSALKLFLEWLEDNRLQSINQLRDKHINDYRQYLETRRHLRIKGRLLSAAHLNRNYFAIDKLLEFLHQYGVEKVPVPVNRRIKMDKQERIGKIEVLTQQEIKTLYRGIPNTYQKKLSFEERQAKQYELKLIFALFYGCGLRRSEGYRLQLQDVDFDKKTVFVRQGKNYKDRTVPMSAGVYEALQDYVYNFRHQLKLKHNRLFISDIHMLRLRLKYLQNSCKDTNIQAKVITLHTLRHSIATHLLQNGMSIESIALFLGHNSLDSTQIYTHLVN